MARTVSTETRQDLLQAVRERYRGSRRKRNSASSMNSSRSRAITASTPSGCSTRAPVASGWSRRARLPVYDEAVREALIVLWEASDRVCGKRLKPLLPLLVSALERHGHLTLDVDGPGARARRQCGDPRSDAAVHPRVGLGQRVRRRRSRRCEERARAHVRRVGGSAARRHGGGSREPWRRLRRPAASSTRSR